MLNRIMCLAMAPSTSLVSHHNPTREELRLSRPCDWPEFRHRGLQPSRGAPRVLDHSPVPSSAHMWRLASPSGEESEDSLHWTRVPVYRPRPSLGSLSVAALILDLPTPTSYQPSLLVGSPGVSECVLHCGTHDLAGGGGTHMEQVLTRCLRCH